MLCLANFSPVISSGEPNKDYLLQGFKYCVCLHCAGYAGNTVVTKSTVQQGHVFADSVTLGTCLANRYLAMAASLTSLFRLSGVMSQQCGHPSFDLCLGCWPALLLLLNCFLIIHVSLLSYCLCVCVLYAFLFVLTL
jgi:hypothetical protein